MSKNKTNPIGLYEACDPNKNNIRMTQRTKKIFSNNFYKHM